MPDQPALLRRSAALLALVVASACLVALVPHAATGDTAAATSRRWSGYPIPGTGRAAGGWIGGYRVGHTPVFLTTPSRKPNRAGFAGPREVGDLPGRAASRAETARAAWILSKYGGYRDATQAAAVDASVYHLLVGGAWRITGPRGARRIRQSGDGASVARFARIMLRQSRAHAGRYTARLAATTADVGGAVAVTVAVTDGHGRPAPGLPVTLAMSGITSAPLVTGDDGRAVARFAADTRGWQDVAATVSQVPDHRLHAWPAERHGQASAAEGGARRELVVTGTTPVRGPQTLSLAPDPGQLMAGASARVLATIGGGDATRTASATLHGPFPGAASAQCSGPAVGSVSASVSGDGGYALPGVTVSGGGYFVWQVAVDGTATSIPVSSCGATVKARSQAATSISDVYVTSLGEVRATGTVSGLPFADKVTVTGKLAGPYGSAGEAATDSCATFDADEAVRSRTGNGPVQFTVAPTVTDRFYAWIAETSPGDLWLGSRSSCAASGTVLYVPHVP